MSKLKTGGFTLLETMIAVGVMSILMVAMFGALQVSMQSERLANAKVRVQSNVRDVLPDVIREIEIAARPATAAGFAGVTGIRVFRDGAQMAANVPGDMIVFQVPTDDAGATWSTPIQYRFVNEDVNGNGYLDIGEDTVNALDPAQDGNGDGILTRWIVREQDLNGDGNFNGLGERRVVKGVNEFQAVQFTLNPAGDFLTITLVARKPMERTGRVAQVQNPQGGFGQQIQGQVLQAQATTRVYILN